MQKYNFPKVELHLHLDGSFRPKTIWELVMNQGVTMPSDSLDGYLEWIHHCANADSVNEYLKMFDAPLQVMQDHDSIKRITKELIEDLASDGVAYAEIRFAPQQHTKKSLSQCEAIEAVLDGRNEALKENSNIDIGIITCMMSYGEETLNWKENMETIQACKKYLGQGVVGIDLAGVEGVVPLKNFGPLFEEAKKLNIPRTCHAGDSPGPDTVEDALNFGAQRIGHGHHIDWDKDLLKKAIELQIPLEICPTSNIQCKTQPSYQEHPAKKLLDQGLPITISVDNMTLTEKTLSDEYDHCLNDMGFTYQDLIQMNLYAIQHAFCDHAIKDKITNQLQQKMEELS